MYVLFVFVKLVCGNFLNIVMMLVLLICFWLRWLCGLKVMLIIVFGFIIFWIVFSKIFL